MSRPGASVTNVSTEKKYPYKKIKEIKLQTLRSKEEKLFNNQKNQVKGQKRIV